MRNLEGESDRGLSWSHFVGQFGSAVNSPLIKWLFPALTPR